MCADFVSSLAQWKALYDSPNPQDMDFPSPYKGIGGLERLVILRILRPDKVVPAVQQFIVDSLGRSFVEPPTFDLAGCYRSTTCCTPLIFILSPGADPMNALMKLADDINFTAGKVWLFLAH